MVEIKKICIWVLDKIFPPKCPFCHRICAEGICATCEEELPRIGSVFCMKCGKPLRHEEEELCRNCRKTNLLFNQGKSIWSNKRAVSLALYRFKYNNYRCYGKIFAKAIFEEGFETIRRWKIEQIIPVPLAKKKRRMRGYNQAEILAKELSIMAGIELNTTALIREKETKPQKKLAPIERRLNLQDAFVVKRPEELKLKILIVDDIYTTGATISEVTRALKSVGVQDIYFFTVCIGMQY